MLQTHQTRELCGNNVCIAYREIPVLKGLFAGKHEALALSWPSVVVLLSNLPVYQWSKVKVTCSKLKKTKVSTGSSTASQDKEHTPMLSSLLFQARERFTICICGQLWSNSLTEPIKTRIQQQPKFSGKERQPASWQVALPGAASGAREARRSHALPCSTSTSPFTQDCKHWLGGDVLRYGSTSSHRKAPHHLCRCRLRTNALV